MENNSRDSLVYYVWLSMQTGISYISRLRLLQQYGSAEELYKAAQKTEPAAEKKLAAVSLDAAAGVIEKCRQQNIIPIPLNSPLYPKRLACIDDPPFVLYVKGSLQDFDALPSVALIGTRKASVYGHKMAVKLGYETAAQGGVIVCGISGGIETACVEAALKAKKDSVIGVLGTAHENAGSSIHRNVLSQGTLISEYPPGDLPHKSNFRARNRIASALSLSVCVIEAPEQSGTMLFVSDAVNQGKELFAVPGNADSDNCRGSNALLKEGARPVTEAWDFLSYYEGQFPGRIKHLSRDELRIDESAKKGVVHLNSRKIEKTIDKSESRDYTSLKKLPESLTDAEAAVLSAITAPDTPADVIISASGLPASKALSALTMLQIKGRVRQSPGKRFTVL